MARPVPFRLWLTAGLIIAAAATLVLDRPCTESADPVVAGSEQPRKALPRSPEHAAVLSWIFKHRPDAASLEVLDWSAPRAVSDNPFNDGPATLVEVVLKNKSTSDAGLEYLAFYLCNTEVLGSTNQPPSGAKVVFCS